MSIFLPVAGISVNLFFLLGAGAMVGFLSGLLGVGGGFLMTPLLLLLGIPPTVAAASDSCQIVAASSSGLAAHFRLGNVDLRMGSLLLAGGLTGGVLGVRVIKILSALGEADALIVIAYIVVLGLVGGSMFLASLRNLRGGIAKAGPKRRIGQFDFLRRLPWQMDFPRSNVRHSVIVPFVLCTIVGVLAAIMGVGGGFMMVPVMVYLLGIPAHVAVGTSLFPILLTSADVTILQATTNHTVDVLLALLLAVGSAVAAQIGARVSRSLNGDQLLITLAGLALLVAGKMLVDIVVPPQSLLAPARAHGSAQMRTSARPAAAAPVMGRTGPAETPPAASAATASRTGDSLPFRIIPPAIQVGTFYSGAHVQVETMAVPQSSVVVVVRGGERDEQFYKMVRIGPIWVSGSRVDISGVPALFYRFSSGAVRTFLRREDIDEYQLDEASIRSQMRIEPEGDRDRIVSSWLKLKAEEGAYALDRRALSRGLEGQNLTLFVADFAWPKRVPAAVYQVTVYECRGGSVVRHSEGTFPVVRVGFPAWLSSLATGRALWYGVCSALAAGLLGFGTDRLMVSIFRKRRA
jgi:uncharacterized membrane protein YfcA